MRGRPPRRIQLPAEDAVYLERLIRDGRTEQRIARRARILLAMADPTTVVEELAAHVEQRRETIWQLCRRYERVGVEAVRDAARAGRPRAFSPSSARRD
jgi:transposase